jgi:hypothetical protein
MSGRLVITIMFLACLFMSIFFYRTLKTAPEHKQLATAQMQMEFINYAQEIKKIETLKVGESQSIQYFVSMKGAWNFIIHDKTLLVTAPAIQSEPPSQVVPPEIQAAAKKPIQDLVFVWLEDKYHTRKDLNVEVHFPNENQ